MKDNYKIVHFFITKENVNSHFKCEHVPKKLESHPTNFVLYDLQTHNTDRERPYNKTFYRLSKLAGRYNRDLTPYEYEKCKNDILVFVCDDCITKALDFLLILKKEERKTENKIVESNLQLHAHNGSGFDTWIISNNHPCDKHIVNINKNGKSIFSIKFCNGLLHNGRRTDCSLSNF